MKEGPDIALLGTMIGDPARANMLVALMSGLALTAGELANEAGITAQTASSHLKKLEQAGLVRQRKQGRHRYFALSDSDVGTVLEAMMGLAASRGLVRSQVGPKDPALRKARICYDHLAGDMAIKMFDSLIARNVLQERDDDITVTEAGRDFFTQMGIDLSKLQSSRRPLCKPCLDWSNRRTHLAGSLGQAILQHFVESGWCIRQDGSRSIVFSPTGETQFEALFTLKSDATKSHI